MMVDVPAVIRWCYTWQNVYYLPCTLYISASELIWVLNSGFRIFSLICVTKEHFDSVPKSVSSSHLAVVAVGCQHGCWVVGYQQGCCNHLSTGQLPKIWRAKTRNLEELKYELRNVTVGD